MHRASRKIVTAGKHQLDEVARALFPGKIVNDYGVQRSVQLYCPVVPDLGRNLFLVKQAAYNGLVSIFDMDNPKLESSNFTPSVSRAFMRPPYSFSLDLTDGSSMPGLAMQVAADATMWYWWLEHFNRKSVDLARKRP